MNSLPSSILAADISQWNNIQPEDFFEREYLKTAVTDFFRADKLLKYSRSIENATYDQMAHRLMAATPVIRGVTLQSLQAMKKSRERDNLMRADDAFEILSAQEKYLVHRPIEIFDEGAAVFTVESSFLEIRKNDDPEYSDINWVFPLSNVPAAILEAASNRDFPQLITQQYNLSMPEINWLPLSTLIDNGRFERMQDIRSRLVNQTGQGNYYCFISHRWLSPVMPDMDGLQARMLAWQLIGYLAEAVRCANQRGLFQPRKFNESLGLAVGFIGSDLAESIIVNVLRYHLNDEALQRVFEETASLPLIEEDYGITMAMNDIDLVELKGLLVNRPILKYLSEKFFVWYDYSCMPQRPFKDDDEQVFKKNLEVLTAMQQIGQTLVMLDDADDYLSRAWCTLESVYADNETALKWFTIAGALRDKGREGMMDYYFSGLLDDRPHIIWRAVLDTELFQMQSPQTCMERLELATTVPADRLFVYNKLKAMKMPVKIHTEDCEVITGVFPLPAATGQGTLLFSKQTEKQLHYFSAVNTADVKSLDWTGLLNLHESMAGCSETLSFFTSGYFQFPAEAAIPSQQNSHVCIVAGCEGEALLICNWLWHRRAQLEDLLLVNIRSLSWLAADIAPVGKILNGQLKTMGVEEPAWIFLAAHARLTNCNTSNMIMNGVRNASRQIIHMAYDRPENNLVVYNKTNMEGDPVNCVNVNASDFFVHNGGLFRWALRDHLVNK